MLKKYLGVKVVFASEMTAKAASNKHYLVSSGEEDGYEVTYETGYKSWCPKTVFESNNVEFKKFPIAESAKMMISTDYKVQFIAEYIQIKVRSEKLEQMLSKWKEDKLDSVPKCSFELLNRQLKAMEEYMTILEMRANIENVTLPTFGEK